MVYNITDLQKHIKTWCPADHNNKVLKNGSRRLDSDDDENDSDVGNDNQRGGGPALKRRRGWQSLVPEMEAEEWQNVGLQLFWKRVYDLYLDVIRSQRKKYQRQGRTLEWIDRKMKQLWEKRLLSSLIVAIEYTHYFKQAPLLQPLLDSLEDLNPSTAPSLIRNKINLFLKPNMKDLLRRIDLSDMMESDTESDMSNLKEEEPNQDADDEQSDRE